MQTEDDRGDVLEKVAQIHPAVDRLRQLLASATLVELKATSGSYWADRRNEDG